MPLYSEREEVSMSEKLGNITLIQADCMDIVKTIADGQFELAIVDPPYGLPKSSSQGSGKLKDRVLNRGHMDWDIPPTEIYFQELMRVSKNQIIWGGNYFSLRPTRGIICWDKVQPFENFSQIEYAWTSFNTVARLFRFDNRTGEKIHPTQKPVELYKWLLVKYAKRGDKILDTHSGSGSICIACHDYGFELTAIEKNSDTTKLQKTAS